jgi:hypothetical protein
MNILIDPTKGKGNPNKIDLNEIGISKQIVFQKEEAIRSSPALTILKRYKDHYKTISKKNNDNILIYINKGNIKLLNNEQ